MSAKVFNVGIIGYGLSAKIFHLPFVHDCSRFQLHAIVQRHPTSDNDASRDFPEAHIYPSVEDLLKDPRIDLVVVTTQPSTHFQLVKQCLEAGKHILCEKPFTPTAKEAYDLASLSKQHDRKLYVYQNRRYDADFLTVRSLLLGDKLGRVADFESHFDRHRPDLPQTESWKTSASEYSALFDLGTHLIDQIVCLYGLPDKVTGFVTRQRQSESLQTQNLPEDSFTAILQFESGVMATARASVVSPEARQLRFWVRGTQGSYLKYHLDPQEDQLRAGLRPGDGGYGIETGEKNGLLTQVDGGKIVAEDCANIETAGYTALYNDLARALDGDTEKSLLVDASAAADVIRLLELVRQSSDEGKMISVGDSMSR